PCSWPSSISFSTSSMRSWTRELSTSQPPSIARIGRGWARGWARRFHQSSLVRFAIRPGPMLYGLIIVGFWLVVSLLAPVIAAYSPTHPYPNAVLAPPGGRFLLGTDRDGLDILSRLL